MRFSNSLLKSIGLSLALVFAAGSRDAAAEGLTLQWDPSPSNNAVGYVVFVGTASGSYTEPIDVGNATSFFFSNAVRGQEYHFAVAAYDVDHVVGPRSTEVSGRVDATLLMSNPGDQASVPGQPTALQLIARDRSGATLSYDAIGLPPGMALDSSTGAIAGTPTEAGTFAVTALVSNGVAYAAEAFVWTIQQAGGALHRVEFAAAISTAVDVAADASGRTHVLQTDSQGRAILSTITVSGAQERNVSFGPFPGWTPRAIAAAPDGRTRLLWTHGDGQVAVWFLSANGAAETAFNAGPFSGWTAMDVSVGPDDRTRLLWVEAGGAAAVYTLSADATYETASLFGPFAGWTALRLDVGSDHRTRLLWSDTSGTAALWFLDAGGLAESGVSFGPFSGWTPIDVGAGADGKTRLLWQHASGESAVWVVSDAGAFERSIGYGPYPGWTARALDVASDNRGTLLWSETTGWTSSWLLSPSGDYEIAFTIPPQSN